MKKSLYRDEVSTRLTSQNGALSGCDGWDKSDYCDPSGCPLRIYPDNPCHHGYILAEIDIEGVQIIII